MAWNDLTIPQRSQLMNIFRRNGVSSLSEMRRLYDLSSPLAEDTGLTYSPVAPIYAEGGKIPPQGGYDYPEDDPDFVGPVIPAAMYAGPPLPPGYGEAPVNQNAVKLKQKYMESTMNDNAYNKGSQAKGAFQITPVVLQEYTQRTRKTGDLYDPEFNEEVRDWYMNVRLPEFEALKRGHPSDSIRTGIGLASFNAGPGTVNKAITKAQAAGIDTDRSFGWLDYLPKETQDYVNFGLRNKDIPNSSKTEAEYNKTLDSLGIKHAVGGNLYGPGGHIMSAEDIAVLDELKQQLSNRMSVEDIANFNELELKLSNRVWNEKQAQKQRRLQKAAKGTKLIMDVMRLYPKTALASDLVDLLLSNPNPDSFEEAVDNSATVLGTTGRTLKYLYGIPFNKVWGGTDGTKLFGKAGRILAIPDLIMDTRTLIKDAKTPYTEYASGGKIHINPKNKGKFTATKKRTGKTTEELTHSKNPLTRKRAIFAQNARKWSHKREYGGIKF